MDLLTAHPLFTGDALTKIEQQRRMVNASGFSTYIILNVIYLGQ